MAKDKNTKEIIVKIDGEKWKEALDKAFVAANKKVKIDGFRPGKAPKEVFFKKYKKESLYMDAGDLVIQEAYSKMLEDNKDLELVARPDMMLNSVDDEKIEFKFILTLKPTVKLGKYKNLGVKKETVEVTDKEIEEAVLAMRNRYAENIEKEDGIVENNDIAIIDFKGLKDGIAFEGGTAENYSLKIGSNTFIPGFEEQIIGMKKGEEKDINVTFPEDYHADDLKGCPVVFKVKVNEIKTVQIPDLNEDFFQDLGMEGINSKETLEKQVRENISTHKESEAENKYLDELLEKASETLEVDIPDAMIEEELHRMLHQYEDNLKMQGLSLEQFYKFTNSDEQALKDQMHDEAVKRIKYRLMLEEIAAVEKVVISDEEADNEAKELAKKYQMSEEDLVKAFGGLDMIKYDLKMRRAMDILKEEK